MVQLHVDLDGECASYLPVPPEMLAELMRESDPLLALIALGIRELAKEPGLASPDEEGAHLETTESVRELESRMSHLSLETRLQFAIVWLEHQHIKAPSKPPRAGPKGCSKSSTESSFLFPMEIEKYFQLCSLEGWPFKFRSR